MSTSDCGHHILVLALLPPQAAFLHDVVNLVHGMWSLAGLPRPTYRVALVQADDWRVEAFVRDVSDQLRPALHDHGERRAADLVAVGGMKEARGKRDRLEDSNLDESF